MHCCHPARFYARPDRRAFGLWCTRAVPRKNSILGTYAGVLHERPDYEAREQRNDQVYLFEISDVDIGKEYQKRGGPSLVLESLNFGSEARFINDIHGHSFSEEVAAKMQTANAHFGWDRENLAPAIFLSSNRPIKVGEEILLDYGSSYWRKVRLFLLQDMREYLATIKAICATILHALESPTERRRCQKSSNKSDMPRINLIAYNEGDNPVVSIPEFSLENPRSFVYEHAAYGIPFTSQVQPKSGLGALPVHSGQLTPPHG